MTGAECADGIALSGLLNIDAVGVVAAVMVDVVDFCELSLSAVAGEDETVEETVSASAVAGLGGPLGEEKKEVIEALAFGFLVAEVAMSAPLRLRGVVIAGTGEAEKHADRTCSLKRKLDVTCKRVVAEGCYDKRGIARLH